MYAIVIKNDRINKKLETVIYPIVIDLTSIGIPTALLNNPTICCYTISIAYYYVKTACGNLWYRLQLKYICVKAHADINI